MKQVLAVIIIFLILILIGGGVWFFFLQPKGEGGDSQKTFLDTFFPFGDSSSIPETSNTDGKSSEEDQILLSQSIREVSRSPVSGFTPTTTLSSSPSLSNDQSVIYFERETGHVYEAPLSVITKKRLSNTTFPGTEEVIWHSKEQKFIARYLSEDNVTILSFAGNIAPGEEGGEGYLDGIFVQDNAISITRGPKDKLFSLKEDTSGVSGITSNFDGSTPTKVFSHILKEWLPQWVLDGSILLTTKPSGTTVGYLYDLTLKNGSLSEVLGGFTGLATLANQNGSRILYSTGGGEFNLFVFESKTKNITELTPATLSEKCVWKKDGITIICGIPKNPPSSLYPDEWYKGKISFSDEVWQINTETGYAEILSNIKDAVGKELDVINPALSLDENYLLFINKSDLSLWSVKLSK